MSMNRPIYAELAAEFIREIGSGRYPVGSMLPTEIELSTERGISRSTARAALNHLVSLGLVSRHKGIGTRVEASTPGSAYNPSATTLEELAHFGAATERRIERIERVVADDELAKRLKCRPGSRWTRVSAIRFDPVFDAPPITWTENFIDDHFAGIAEKIPAYKGLIINLIHETFGVSVDEVRQIIRAVVMPADIAEALSAEPRAPALEITRRYKSMNSVPMISISIHPSDRFEYSMSLRRPLSR